MRRALLALLLGACLAGPAPADQTDPRLGPLLDRLKAARDLAEAEAIEGEIWQIWTEIANPASSILMDQAVQAMQQARLDTAVTYLDALAAIEPDVAEVWNKRATVHFLRGDYAASVADIQRTLALEPRHFGALSGLGLIYLALDEPEAALRSFEAALVLYPLMPGPKAHVEALRSRVGGDPT